MPDSQEQKNGRRKQPNSFLKYSGMAGQMIAIMLVFAFGGIKLDEYCETTKPFYTGGLTILGVILAMYFMIKDLIKK
jgi:F0F1-type ATP synthase assembly protein I